MAHLREQVQDTGERGHAEPGFQSIVDFIPFPIVVISLDDNTILFINRKGAGLFGLTHNAVTGREADLLLTTELRTQLLDEIDRAGTTAEREWLFQRPDGSPFWALVSGTVADMQGERVLVVGLNDISEHKVGEDEITRLKEFNESIVQQMTEGVVVEDAEGLFTFVNPAMCRMLGRSLETLLGTHWTAATLPKYHEVVRDANRRRTNGEAHRYELELVHQDGSGVPILISGRPLFDSSTGEFAGSLAVFTNISESKRVEEELRHAKEAAEAANRAKSTFLANMSHELRTPLNAILGFSELMQADPDLSDEQRDNLGIINRSGEHLLRLINDVLDMAKIEAGRTVLQEHNFNLHTLLNDLSEVFGLRAESKGIALLFDCPSDLPRFIRADERKLRQVLMNLLNNAIKFTDEGQVLLNVEMREMQKLHFEVRDTGRGIDPQELETIFEPFLQATQQDGTQEGTGLGLSISRQFVRLMGGDMHAESAYAGGQGSVFWFDIPVILVPDAAIPEPVRRRARAVGLEPGQPAHRLLVVEDNEASRILLVQLLTRLGFETQAAANGQECLKMWATWQPHLIWMDMRMPVMDGHEATRQIKGTSQGQATAIIALTASVFEDDITLVLTDGCDDFVRKPFREQEIIEKLSKYLGVRFIYAEEESEQGTIGGAENRTGTQRIQGSGFEGLSSEWRNALKQAAIQADADEMLSIAGQIRNNRPGAADAIEAFVKAFDYNALLSALDRAGSEVA